MLKPKNSGYFGNKNAEKNDEEKQSERIHFAITPSEKKEWVGVAAIKKITIATLIKSSVRKEVKAVNGNNNTLHDADE